MRTSILVTAVVALVAVGCGSDSHGSKDSGVDDDGGGGNGTSGNGSSGNGTSGNGTGGNGTGTSGTGGAPGVVVGDGSQLAGCRTTADCDTGLNCYTFGGYCSAQCTTNADCTSLGANYGCYMAPGGGFGMMGGMIGGMMGGTGGAAAGGASGTCRISCMGTDDTSCPDGFMCIDVGGGGAMMSSFRCALPGVNNGMMGGTGGMMGGTGGRGGMMGTGGRGGMMGTGGRGGMMQMPGTTGAFEQCQGGGCETGLTCGASGYCTQQCQNDGECTEDPSSGDINATCGRNRRCVLACTEDSNDDCPNGMTCNVAGGGNNGNDAGTAAIGRCGY